MARGEKIMFEYLDKDNYIDSFWKSFIWLSVYETDSEKYGITTGFTITFLGTNYNFEKKVK